MLDGVDIATIVDITELSVQKIEELKKIKDKVKFIKKY